jgi:hypothetical protein
MISINMTNIIYKLAILSSFVNKFFWWSFQEEMFIKCNQDMVTQEQNLCFHQYLFISCGFCCHL